MPTDGRNPNTVANIIRPHVQRTSTHRKQCAFTARRHVRPDEKIELVQRQAENLVLRAQRHHRLGYVYFVYGDCVDVEELEMRGCCGDGVKGSSGDAEGGVAVGDFECVFERGWQCCLG